MEKIQSLLSQLNLDGWLLYDFRGNNPIALEFLRLPPDSHLTRRLFYWIPRVGAPVKIVHRIESSHLDHMPGETRPYSTWQELESLLRSLLADASTVAMEFSPRCALPYTSLVDAGTVDLVRHFDVMVVSSEQLVQAARPRLTEAQFAFHREVAQILDETVERAWLFIRDHMEAGGSLTELEVQEFILCEFEARGLLSDHPPICATGANSADPHHTPGETPIRRGDLVLIDLWAKLDRPDAIFADFTKVAVADTAPTERHLEVFETVKGARDAALALLRSKDEVQGWELDRAARSLIEEAGFGDHFVHRLGHDIGTELHGPGTHLDDYETHDTRTLVPGSCFSVEPGIYLPGEFGVRLECDVLLMQDGTLEVTGSPHQTLAGFLRD